MSFFPYMHRIVQQCGHRTEYAIVNAWGGSKGVCSVHRCLDCIDGLEKHLLDTANIDAPTLMIMGVMVPLLLYAESHSDV